MTNKTIYIDKKVIDSGILNEKNINNLPDDILSALYSMKTSLGKNPSFNNNIDSHFIERVLSNRYRKLSDRINSIPEYEGMSFEELNNVLSELYNDCVKLEINERNRLEKIAINYVIELFGIPDDMIDISANLCDEMNIKHNIINVDSLNTNKEYIDSSIDNEVYKRRILNILAMGCGMSYSSDIKTYYEDIEYVNENLCEYYERILLLNEYLLFSKNKIGINDKDTKLNGNVIVSIGNSEDKIKVEANGVIFPILISELIRGLMEVFCLTSLPQDENIKSIILNRSDFIKSEPWDMRFGYSFWKIFSSYFKNTETIDIPYIMMNVSNISTKLFNKYFAEILKKSMYGRRIMNKEISKAVHDREYSDFEGRMDMKSVDKSIITDDIIKESIINSDNQKVPNTCPVCGSKVGLFIKGEPIYLCTNKKCNKYFGTAPFNK